MLLRVAPLELAVPALHHGVIQSGGPEHFNPLLDIHFKLSSDR